jgi:hypothetical protein
MSAAFIAKGLGGHRSGDGYLCHCPVPSHGKGNGDKHPSLLVSDGETRTLVTCFAGCDRSDVLTELRHRCLLEGDADPTGTRLRQRRLAQPEREPEPDPEALALWQAADPIGGTLAEHYLRHHRGIGLIPPTFRFLRGVRYPHSGISRRPAMSRVTLPKEVTALHIFADNDAAGKVAAERAVARFTRDGKRVLLRWPPDGCKDWNDVLLSKRRAA